ncbi:hypothetical protein ACVHNT_13790 (plasmid) [Acinetobacter pseudolwoffii]
MTKLLTFSLLFFSFEVVALTPEQARTKVAQQNSKNDIFLIEVYKVLEYKRESLKIAQDLNTLQATISKTSDKNELTRLYCIEYRKLKQQTLDTNKKFYATTYKTNTIYVESLNKLNTLTTACRNNNITKFHIEENDFYLRYNKYIVDGLAKRKDEYNQYNDTKNIFEDMLILRKKLVEEDDSVTAQNILCIDFLNKTNELTNKSSAWTISSLVKIRTQLKESTAKLKEICRERGY